MGVLLTLADELGAHRLGRPNEMTATRGRLTWSIGLAVCGDDPYIVLAPQHFRHRLLNRRSGGVILELLLNSFHVGRVGVLQRKRAVTLLSPRARTKQRPQVEALALAAS